MSASACRNRQPDGIFRDCFRQLRRLFANAVDAGLIADALVEKRIVSLDDCNALRHVRDPVERCGKLLRLVETSAEDDEAFRQLRLIVERVPAYGWIVEEIDEKHESLVRDLEAANQMKLAKAGYTMH